MLRFRGIFVCLGLLMLSSPIWAAGYSCPTLKKYTSCSSGYYMTVNGSYNATATTGNACSSCPSGCTCAGGTAAPVCGVSCGATTYWNGSSCVTCIPGYYCPGFTNISNPVNGQGANPCDGADQYQDEYGQTTCKTVSAGFYRVDRTAQAQCTGTTYCTGGVKYECPAGYDANTDIGKTAISQCQIECPGGAYLDAENATTCTDVGAGYWAAASKTGYGNVGVRNVCPDGQTTYGRGLGADEAGDCGYILHVGPRRLFLRSDKKTIPSLNVRIGDQIFYGNMRTAPFAKGNMLHILVGDTNYSAYDDGDAGSE